MYKALSSMLNLNNASHLAKQALVSAGLVIWVSQVNAQVSAQHSNWEGLNREVSLQVGSLQQKYREIDTQGLTSDGTLNTESGSWQRTAVQFRWQGQLPLASYNLPLWLQANSAQATGQTDYDGYLQSGNTLTPFRAKTSNAWRSRSAALGVPLNSEQVPNWQVVPYVLWGRQQWHRNLVQYGETYSHKVQGLGFLIQWQVTPFWLLEASHQHGRHQTASVRAPILGFVADLGLRRQTQTSLSLNYQVSRRWSAQLQALETTNTQGASAVVNGLLAPPSATRQTQIGVALAWHY